MLAGFFASLAEYERELINERAADARAAAKARGQQTGRPKAFTDDQARQLRAPHAGGESVVALAKSYSFSPPTVYRHSRAPCRGPQARKRPAPVIPVRGVLASAERSL
jgi:DNA invertase Pin-like site-specific DNA recombinase